MKRRHTIQEVARAKLLLLERQQQGALEPELQGLTLEDLVAPYLNEWAIALLPYAPYKAIFGSRAGAKSHTFATIMLGMMLLDPSLQCVVIRKYRADITSSAQLLLRLKIQNCGWDKYFDCQGNTIKRIGGTGHIVFKGLQGHNSTGIKSFENYLIAWVEEATEVDQFSLDQLIPTIRSDKAQLWFSWNPDQPTDPVDRMFRRLPPKDAIILSTSFRENRFITKKSLNDEREMRESDPDKWEWVWNGGYNLRSDAIVFSGKWRIAELNPTGWDGPYHGGDFGFAADPTCVHRYWKAGNQIYAEYESYAYRLDTIAIAPRWIRDIPGIENHVIRCDSARPETIAHLKSHGLAGAIAVNKAKGSVESGVDWLRSHEIIVHPRCTGLIDELGKYRYKTNKAGDILSQLEDKDNHAIDGMRYAFEPLIASHGTQYGEARAYW